LEIQTKEVHVRRLIFALLVLALSLVSVLALNGRQDSGTRNSQKTRIIADLQSVPAKHVTWVNAEGAPIAIQMASAREIPPATYLELTGEPTNYPSMSTYPDTALVNTSSKAITSFVIMLKSKVDKSLDGSGATRTLYTRNLSVPSGSAYKLGSESWLMAEKVSAKQEDGTFKPAWRQPGLDTRGSWLPGGPSDLHVVVFRVVFEDGSEWRVPENFEW
jgi:hypothetical protein